MNRTATNYLALLAGVLALWSLDRAVRRREINDDVVVGVAALELGLLVHAVADVVSLLAGHRPRQPEVHLAYLVVSVGLLPVLLGHQRDRWSFGLVGVGCGAVAVVLSRMWTTWSV